MNMTPQPEANSHGNPKTKLKKLETPYNSSLEMCVSASTYTSTYRYRYTVSRVYLRYTGSRGSLSAAPAATRTPCAFRASQITPKTLQDYVAWKLNFLYVINMKQPDLSAVASGPPLVVA